MTNPVNACIPSFGISLRRHLLPIGMALLLAGCGSTGIRPGSDDGERWQLSGKIGVRGPQLAESAYLNWRQCGDVYDMRISGPLGQAVARIEGRAEHLRVQFEGRDAVETDDPETLMQQQLGWSIPLFALRYWVRGEAAPGSSAERSGPAARPDVLRQLGWEVNYLDYYENKNVGHEAKNTGEHASNNTLEGAATVLPARLKVSAPAAVQATLLIKEWVLGSAVSGCH